MKPTLLIGPRAFGAGEAHRAVAGSSGYFFARALGRRRSAHYVDPHDGYVKVRNTGGYRKEDFIYASLQDTALPRLMAEAGCSVALGPDVFTALTGVTLPSVGRDKLFTKAFRGFVFEGAEGWILPTYFPGDLLGDKGNTPALLWDIEKARGVAAGDYTHWRPECLVDPSLRDWEAYVEELLTYIRDAERPVVATDIETPYKRGRNEGDLEPSDDPSFTIDDISFAFEGHRGVTVTWGMPYRPGIEAIFRALAQRVEATAIVWNLGYDRPRLRHNLGPWALPLEGCRDTMLWWHILNNSVDRGLGFATASWPLGQGQLPAWKHLGQYDPYYRVVDSVALWRNDRDIRLLLEATGQLGVAQLFGAELPPLLGRLAEGGLLVDEALRSATASRLASKLGDIRRTLTEAVPEELRPRKVWKTRRAAEAGLPRVRLEEEDESLTFREIEATTVVNGCSACGAAPVTREHVTRKTLKPLDTMAAPS